MFRLLSSAVILATAFVGDAMAQVGPSVPIPAPELGESMVGIMLSAGIVYLINRRRSR